MCNTQKILYEYFLKDGEVRKSECTILSKEEVSREGMMYQFTKNDLYGSRFVYDADLGKVQKNHIYAFDDDIEKYTAVFAEYVETKIKTLQQQLYRNKKVLKKIKSKIK